MKYMLLIHQGTTPTPGSEEWDGPVQGEAGGGLRRLPSPTAASSPVG